MDFLVTALMGFICKNKDLSKEDYKIYQYGLQACLEMMFCFFSVFCYSAQNENAKRMYTVLWHFHFYEIVYWWNTYEKLLALFYYFMWCFYICTLFD